MSKEIENKVVSLTFDNSKFQQKMSETLRGLSKLKESLGMSGATKGIGHVQDAFNKFNTSGMRNGVGDVQKSLNSLDTSTVSRGIEGVGLKFMAMSAVAIQAITSITGALGRMGADFAKQFTLAPVMDGFAEYETNIGSIQTILANTDRHGTTLDEVTASLDELNIYADKTIYNFGQMTKNIGLFTNAGIKIEDATAMIKGFSNMAAASGTTAEGAAGAAYQLSQALSNGKITLMDWKSLTNVGMGNKNMQQGIIEIASSMGTMESAGVSAEAATQNFNSTLQEGWLTADVMSNYLRIMAGDMDEAAMKSLGLSQEQVDWFNRQQQISEDAATKVRTFTQLIGTVKEAIGSGWSSSFRTILGDFNEASGLFTTINNIFSGMVDKSAQARNSVLEGWAALGGRSTLIQGFVNVWKGFFGILNPIREAFRELFPKSTAQSLLKLTTRFRDFTKSLIVSEGTADKIFRIFRGFFSLIKFGINIVTGIAKVFGALFKAVSGGGDRIGVLSMMANVMDFITFLTGGPTKYGLKGNPIGKFFDGIVFAIENVSKVIQTVAKFIFGALGGIANFVGSVLVKGFRAAEGVFKKFASAMAAVGRAVQQAYNILVNGDFVGEGPFKETDKIVGVLLGFRDKVAEIVDGIVDQFKRFVKIGGDALKPIGDLFGKAFDDISSNSVDVGDVLTTVADKTLNFFTSIGSGIESAIAWITRAVSSIGSSAGDFFGSLFGSDDGGNAKNQMAEQDKAVGGIVGNIRTLTSALDTMETKAENSKSIWEKIIAPFVWAKDVLISIKDGIVSSIRELMGGIGDAIASDNAERVFSASIIGMLAKTILNISSTAKSWDLDKDIKRVMKSVRGVLNDFGDVLGGFERKLKAEALKQLAIGIAILTASMIALSFIDAGKLTKAGLAMSGMFAALVTSLKALDSVDSSGRKIIGMAGAMIVMSSSMIILAGAIKLFSMMDEKELGTGMTAIAAIMLGFVGFLEIVRDQNENIAKVGLSMIGMSIALIFMSEAIKRMAKMDYWTIIRGLVGVAGAMAIIVGAMVVMGKEDTARAGLGMLMLAYSLRTMAEVVEAFGKMDWEALKQGLGATLILVAAMSVAIMALPNDAMAKAAGLLILAGAMWVISKAVENLAAIDSGDMTKALIGLGLALVGIVAAAMLASGSIVGAGALLLIAGAVTVLADALVTFSKMSIAQIATSIIAVATAMLVLGAAGAVLGILSPLIMAFGVALVFVGAGMLAFGLGAKFLALAITTLLKTGGTGMTLFIEMVKMFLRELPEMLSLIIAAILQSISEFLSGLPPLVDDVGKIIEAILDVIIAMTPKFFDAFLGFLLELANAIQEATPEIVETFGVLLSALLDTIIPIYPKLVEAGLKFVLSLLQGIRDNMPQIVTIVSELITAFLLNLAKNLPLIISAGVALLVAFIDGITQEIANIGSAVTTLITTFITEVGNNAQTIIDAGVDLIIDFLSGVRSNVTRVSEALSMTAVSVVGSILDAFTDAVVGLTTAIIDFIVEFLEQMGQTFRDGGPKIGRALRDFAGDVVAGIIGAIQEAFGLTDWVDTFGDVVSGIMGGLADGLTGISPKQILKTAIETVVGWLPGWAKDILGISSPSKVFATIGGDIISGLAKGITSNWPKKLLDLAMQKSVGWVTDWGGKIGTGAMEALTLGMYKGSTKLDLGKSLKEAAKEVSKQNEEAAKRLGGTRTIGLVGDVQPRVTPVLDLSKIKMGVNEMDKLISGSSMAANVSMGEARLISLSTSRNTRDDSLTEPAQTNLNFTQNNYSPKSLSTAEIYRNTNGQIAKVKKEIDLAS